MSQLIEVILSLLVVFVFFSAIVSAIVEFVNSRQLVQKRQMYLLKSIMEALNDNEGYSWGTLLYRQPAIIALKSKKNRYPAYISASTFADAVLSMLREFDFQSRLHEVDGKLKVLGIENTATFTYYSGVVNSLNEGRFKQMMSSFLIVSDGKDADKLQEVKANIVRWFNNYQDRVSGEYRRSVQRDLLWYGLLVAALFNVNLITITKAIVEDDSLRSSLVAKAEELAESEMESQGEFICENCTQAQFDEKYQKFLDAKIDELDNGARWYANSGLPILWKLPLSTKQRKVQFLQNKINVLNKLKEDTVAAIESRYCMLQAFSTTSNQDSITKAANALLVISNNELESSMFEKASERYGLGMKEFKSLDHFWRLKQDSKKIAECLPSAIKSSYQSYLADFGCIDRINMVNQSVQQIDDRIHNYELEIELYDELYSYWDKNPIYRVFAIPAYNLRTSSDFLIYLLGIGLMALSGMVSSTTWFQILVKLVDVRNAGAKPKKDE